MWNKEEYMKYYNQKQEVKDAKKLWRLNHPKYSKKYMKTWNREHPNHSQKWDKEHLESKRINARVYCLKSPEKIKAHNTAHYHTSLGLFCELCPDDDVRTENLERHHPDYTYPEIVVTLCKECHEGLD
jgi:hypothetical protein